MYAVRVFVTLEGPEGAGKSSVMRGLAHLLESDDIKVLTTGNRAMAHWDHEYAKSFLKAAHWTLKQNCSSSSQIAPSMSPK